MFLPLLLLSTLLPATLSTVVPTASAAEAPTTALGPTALSPALPMNAALTTALASRDHATAVRELQAMDVKSLSGVQQADRAFLLAWSLQRAGRGSEAIPLVSALEASPDAPASYVAVVSGELLLADGKPLEAISRLTKVTEDGAIGVRAKLALADAYQKAGRTADSKEVYAAMLTRPDPASGSATALWVMAQRVGLSSPGAQAYLRRLYRYYPGSAEDTAAKAHFSSPTLEDLSVRGYTLQDKGRYSDAVALLAPRLAEATTKDATGCRYRFAYGRAQNKNNNLSMSIDVLGPVGKACKGVDDDAGAKALYLTGKALERKKEWGNAASYYRLIPELYPSHSMADDGYALGGIALQEAGDLGGARGLWAKGLEAFPEGDLAAESAWRLAWGAFLSGDTAEAIHWADHSVSAIPMTADATHSLAARYWAARWRAWPSATEHRKKGSEKAVEEAVARFASLAEEEPWSYYSILSAGQLSELAPDKQKALKRPVMDKDDAPWQVRSAFLEEAGARNALGLLRVGLLTDALSELGTLDEDTLTGAEMAILTGIQTRAGNFLFAHDRLRAWLKTHPPGTLGPNRYKVLRQAYPQQYWAEIQAATTGYPWDPEIFHALVREESNFNPQIKSHAGACGLSQLMPATAASSAKKMGLPFSSAKIWDIPTNLKIGAWYLDKLHTRYKGDTALALAGYNAGEGNADRWVAASPDAPLDYTVETISFRETRFYVKRVTSTWQTYRLLYGKDALYADWSPYNHDAVP